MSWHEPGDVRVVSKYPFDDWLDGRVWFLRPTIDFTCLATSMQSMLHGAAKQQDKAVSSRLVLVDWAMDAYGVLVQAYPIADTWKPRLQMIDHHKVKKAMANPR